MVQPQANPPNHCMSTTIKIIVNTWTCPTLYNIVFYRSGLPKVCIEVSSAMNTVHITCIYIIIQNAFLRFGNGVCYKLIGVVVHHTLGFAGGHYTCYFHDHCQNQWFYANDEKVIADLLWVCIIIMLSRYCLCCKGDTSEHKSSTKGRSFPACV